MRRDRTKKKWTTDSVQAFLILFLQNNTNDSAGSTPSNTSIFTDRKVPLTDNHGSVSSIGKCLLSVEDEPWVRG